MNSPISHSVSRRRFLQMTSAGAAGVAVAASTGLSLAAEAQQAQADNVSPSGAKRALRVAYLTDVHVQPERRAPEGMVACLKHLQAMKDKPDLMLIGGDCIMDAFAQNRDRTKTQWDLWHAAMKAENPLPYKACLGNHDIWGWDQSKSGALATDAGYGKAWAVETLAMPARYYSFAQGGWHFIALDSTQPGNEPWKYSAYLDAEQMDWLKAELKRVPATTPILIYSHIPIFSAIPQLQFKREKPSDDAKWPASLVHTDAGELMKLFKQHPNVKTCLSGHLHQVEDIRMNGVEFHNIGAVCGGWWKGPNQDFAEGFAVVDLYVDGSQKVDYLTYGWKAETA